MPSIINQLFRRIKTKESHEDLFSFIETTVEELVNYPDGINDIYNRKIDGFLIKNALSQNEVESLLGNFFRIFPEKKTVINEGLSMYPLPFSQVEQKNTGSRNAYKAYFEESLEFRRAFQKSLGFDFEKRVQSVLGKIANGRNIVAPPGFDNEGSYLSCNFRALYPAGNGTLKAHCGNYFHHEFPGFFKHLEEKSRVLNQLSYFTMLQESEEGGELVIYDVEWEEAEIRLKGDTVLKTKKDKLLDLENPRQVKRRKIKPGPGDMIVFAGGQIWHKVQAVGGTKERITLGGFLSLSNDDKSVFTWT